MQKQWPYYQVKKTKRRKKTGLPAEQIALFLGDKYCFIPHHYYLKENISKSPQGSHFYDTIPYGANYVPLMTCEKSLESLIIFLGDGTKRIEYYEMEMIDSTVKFGMAYSFDFIVAAD